MVTARLCLAPQHPSQYLYWHLNKVNFSFSSIVRTFPCPSLFVYLLKNVTIKRQGQHHERSWCSRFYWPLLHWKKWHHSSITLFLHILSRLHSKQEDRHTSMKQPLSVKFIDNNKTTAQWRTLKWSNRKSIWASHALPMRQTNIKFSLITTSV